MDTPLKKVLIKDAEHDGKLIMDPELSQAEARETIRKVHDELNHTKTLSKFYEIMMKLADLPETLDSEEMKTNLYEFVVKVKDINADIKLKNNITEALFSFTLKNVKDRISELEKNGPGGPIRLT